MEEDEMTYGIDRLAELLAERGIEFCVGDRTSLVFMDGVGNLHECWMAGAEENLVNVCITITPEQALSVRDLNGIVSENAKLRKLLANALMVCGFHGRKYLDSYLREEEGATLLDELRDVGIEVDAMGKRADQSHEPSPIRLENETGITDELREKIHEKVHQELYVVVEADDLYAIADRIDEQEHKLRKQRDGFRRGMVAAQDLLEKRTDERDELQAKLDAIREALDG